MSFPAVYLATLGDTLYLAPDTKGAGYLTVKSAAGYEEFCLSLKEKYSGNDLREAMRTYCGETISVEPDKLGRITIPEELVAHAALKGKVVVVGMFDEAEIWEEQAYIAYQKEHGAAAKRMLAEDD